MLEYQLEQNHTSSSLHLALTTAWLPSATTSATAIESLFVALKQLRVIVKQRLLDRAFSQAELESDVQ
jgi:hypothetical protein